MKSPLRKVTLPLLCLARFPLHCLSLVLPSAADSEQGSLCGPLHPPPLRRLHSNSCLEDQQWAMWLKNRGRAQIIETPCFLELHFSQHLQHPLAIKLLPLLLARGQMNVRGFSSRIGRGKRRGGSSSGGGEGRVKSVTTKLWPLKLVLTNGPWSGKHTHSERQALLVDFGKRSFVRQPSCCPQ